MQSHIVFEEYFSKDGIDHLTLDTDIFDVFLSFALEDNISIILKIYTSDNQPIINKEVFFSSLVINKVNKSLHYELTEDFLYRCNNIEIIPKIDIFVKIPELSSVSVSATHSQIHVENILTEKRIKTVNGNIFIKNSGNGTIESTNGSISAKNISENYDLNTITGKILIENGIGGVVTAKTTNGNMMVKNVNYAKIYLKSENGNITVRTMGGDTQYLEMISTNGNLAYEALDHQCKNTLLSTKNSNIQISLIKDIILNLDLATKEGEIKSDIDYDNADEIIIDNRKFYLKFGDEYPIVKAKAMYGNIFIKKSEYKEEKKINFSTKRKKYSPDQDSDLDETIENDVGYKIDDNEQIETPLPHPNKNEISGKVSGKFAGMFYRSKEGLSDLGNKLKNISFKKNNDTEAKLKILEMLENKKISLEEAERLLEKLKS